MPYHPHKSNQTTIKRQSKDNKTKGQKDSQKEQSNTIQQAMKQIIKQKFNLTLQTDIKNRQLNRQRNY